jgi:hypothetical protein
VKSSEFITEVTVAGKEIVISPEFRRFAEVLKSECQPYLKSIDFDLYRHDLYHGRRGVDQVTVLMCPVNRKPKDTPLAIHQIADAYFEETTGIKFRSNALFATGSQGMARDYGNPLLVIPRGEFTACWSPEISDLTEHLDMFLFNHYPSEVVAAAGFSKSYWVGDTNNRNLIGAIKWMLDDGDYQVGAVKEAVRSKNEVMLHAESFYLLPLYGPNNDSMVVNLMTAWGETV